MVMSIINSGASHTGTGICLAGELDIRSRIVSEMRAQIEEGKPGESRSSVLAIATMMAVGSHTIAQFDIRTSFSILRTRNPRSCKCVA